MGYFTEDEIKKMPKKELLSQAVLGIQSCKTKGDVVDILEDIWATAVFRVMADLPE